jgi:hypothetical protein
LGKKYTSLMLAGAAVCVAVCIFLIWRIMSTKDTGIEWILIIFVLLSFGFFGGAYINEKMSRTSLPLTLFIILHS